MKKRKITVTKEALTELNAIAEVLGFERSKLKEGDTLSYLKG